MIDQQSLDWVRSMRLQMLHSLFELSDLHLQAASWLNPAASNPHYTFIEFIESSPCRDKELLEYHKSKSVINESEYNLLLRLTEALTRYSPPHDDWYNHEAILRDGNWHTIVKTADSVLQEILSLSFNSQQWLEMTLIKASPDSPHPRSP